MNKNKQLVSKKMRRQNYRFILWAHRTLRRRGFRIDLNACNVGQVVKVGEVLSLGQGCIFKPQLCYGCFLTQYTQQHLCWLKNSWIPCPLKVQKGETIFIPSLTQILLGLPILKLEKNRVFHSSLYV